MKKVFLTLGAVVRDQEHYIQEWLTFHHLMGVERFVIALHKCKDKTLQKIEQLPFQKKIRIAKITNNEQFVQMGTYQWIADEFGKYTEWMMFLDSDEFFFGTREDDLRVLLANDYKDHTGLAAHWMEFGSNGHVLRPPLRIEAFTKRAADNCGAHYLFKTIFKPKHLVKILSPHLVRCEPMLVTEDHQPVKEEWNHCGDRQPTWNHVRCNHYHTGSMEDWVQRVRRGQCNDAIDTDFANLYNCRVFKERDRDEVTDTAILRFLKPVKGVLSCVEN